MKNDLRRRATDLRKKGLSYNEIRKEIGVSKSTLSTWLKMVPLAAEHKERFYTKQIYILSLGSKSQKERRAREVADIVRRAEEEVSSPVSFEAYRLMGAALYWAEGSKYNMFELTNSDPRLILFFVRWVDLVFGVRSGQLKMRLNIHAQQDESEIKKFWSELTGIPLANFGKTYIKPPGRGFKKNNLYYGTARVEVPRSVDMRHRVFGWIKGATRSMDRDIEFIERKWHSLKEKERPINL
ncbi:MAG: hypothetical protein KGI60_02475 [Patescibacteria group bacterium]|nr:hypothetical protein [Patescibacteria group bacterium]